MTSKKPSKVVIEPYPRVPASSAIRAGDFVFVAGQISYDDNGNVIEGSIEEQTRVALDRIAKVLAKAGCGMEDVVKTTIWLQDPRDFGRFDRVYGEYFQKDPPTRVTVQANLLLDIKIEIEAIAYKPL